MPDASKDRVSKIDHPDQTDLVEYIAAHGVADDAEALKETIHRLRADNDELREENQDLRATLQPRIPAELGMTPIQEKLAGLLARAPFATREAAFTLLYRGRREPPKIHVIAEHMARLRRALAPFGITVRTERGRGWGLCAEHRAKLKDLIENPRQIEIEMGNT